jgi:penicillin-binding protein 1A
MAAGKTGTSSATMDVWFIGFTSRWMTTTWVGDDLRQRPLGAKDAAFMLTVPMFARFINEVTVGQPLREIPWERPPGVKPNDTGGKLRTTVEEVVGDGKKPGTGGGTRSNAPAAPKINAAPKTSAATEGAIKPAGPVSTGSTAPKIVAAPKAAIAPTKAVARPKSPARPSSKGPAKR